jgi:hypothetical protein
MSRFYRLSAEEHPSGRLLLEIVVELPVGLLEDESDDLMTRRLDDMGNEVIRQRWCDRHPNRDDQFHRMLFKKNVLSSFDPDASAGGSPSFLPLGARAWITKISFQSSCSSERMPERITQTPTRSPRLSQESAGRERRFQVLLLPRAS